MGRRLDWIVATNARLTRSIFVSLKKHYPLLRSFTCINLITRYLIVLFCFPSFVYFIPLFLLTNLRSRFIHLCVLNTLASDQRSFQVCIYTSIPPLHSFTVDLYQYRYLIPYPSTCGDYHARYER